MNIYQSPTAGVINVPYTYLIGWSKLDRWYYGSRYSKKAHPSDLWKVYFTSSKHVAKFRKLFGEPDIVQVRKTFDNALKCYQWETKVLQRLNVTQNPKWLNKNAGYKNNKTLYPSGNHLQNTISVVAANGQIVRVEKSLVDMSIMSGIAKGKTCVKDIHTGEIKQIDKSDLHDNQSYVGVAKNTVVVRDNQGNKYRISTQDPRYLTGEMVQNRSKMCYAQDESGTEYWIKYSDTRLRWRELTWIRDCPYNTTQNQVREGLINCRDIHGNNYRLPKSDKRIVSGELIYWRTHMCIAVDKDNKSYWLPLKDNRIGVEYTVQSICPHNPQTDYLKGSIHVLIAGVKTRIKKDDPRIASGVAIPYSTRKAKSS